MTERRLRAKYLDSAVALGVWGEKIAARLLRQHNHTASIRRNSGYDIRARDKSTGEIRYIEVKTARKGRDKKWRFTLEKNGHTSASNSDVVILLAIDVCTITVFVIPVCDLNGKRAIAITSNPQTYKGRFAQYRENWGTINGNH